MPVKNVLLFMRKLSIRSKTIFDTSLIQAIICDTAKISYFRISVRIKAMWIVIATYVFNSFFVKMKL